MPATRLRRLMLTLVIATFALLGASGALMITFRLNFQPSPPRADYPTPKSALEAQRQDLDYFSRAMALDRAFSAPARTAAEARIRALQGLPEALPPPRLHVALMQVMGLADNGHSRLDSTADAGTLLLPVRVTRFAEGFFVMRAAGPYRDMLGGRVDSIDGHAINEILPLLETLRGGVGVFRRQNAAHLMVVQDLLFGLGLAANPNASTWTVTLPDGRVVTRRLEALALQKGAHLPRADRWLSPEPNQGQEQDWIAYRPRAGQVAQTWQDFELHFRLSTAAGGCAQVVRLQNISDADGQKLVPFLRSTEASLRAHPPCAVILDLRGNGGGDYTNTWHFSHALPHLVRPNGRILVLTDSATFSAAITTAAFIKEAGGAQVILIGEPVGDRLSFYSEGGSACLPNLKVCVHYQTGKHDYAHACNSWRECFWLNWLYPVRVESLQPDRLVPLTFADWDAGRDAAYDVACALVDATPG